MLMLSIGGITMASWLMMMACMQTAIPPIMFLGIYCTILALKPDSARMGRDPRGNSALQLEVLRQVTGVELHGARCQFSCSIRTFVTRLSRVSVQRSFYCFYSLGPLRGTSRSSAWALTRSQKTQAMLDSSNEPRKRRSVDAFDDVDKALGVETSARPRQQCSCLAPKFGSRKLEKASLRTTPATDSLDLQMPIEEWRDCGG